MVYPFASAGLLRNTKLAIAQNYIATGWITWITRMFQKFNLQFPSRLLKLSVILEQNYQIEINTKFWWNTVRKRTKVRQRGGYSTRYVFIADGWIWTVEWGSALNLVTPFNAYSVNFKGFPPSPDLKTFFKSSLPFVKAQAVGTWLTCPLLVLQEWPCNTQRNKYTFRHF